MQHFKLVNSWIRGFVFWCHEQVIYWRSSNPTTNYKTTNPEFSLMQIVFEQINKQDFWNLPIGEKIDCEDFDL